MSKPKTRKAGRDSGNGRFIPISEAKRRPATTEIESVRIGKRRKKK